MLPTQVRYAGSAIAYELDYRPTVTAEAVLPVAGS
ncbi:hypothetical protein M2432_002413 [Mycobacterium sp. OTB74]|nr:hypothetical protein [Mycobacterium sp. OTB74]